MRSLLLSFVLLQAITAASDSINVPILVRDGCRVDSPYFNVPWSGSYGDDLDECS